MKGTPRKRRKRKVGLVIQRQRCLRLLRKVSVRLQNQDPRYVGKGCLSGSVSVVLVVLCGGRREVRLLTRRLEERVTVGLQNGFPFQ